MQSGHDSVEQIIFGRNGRRYYHFCDEFVVFEDYKTATPVLIVKGIGKRKLTVGMFEVMKRICSQLFGESYTLRIGSMSNHCVLKTVRLLSVNGDC